MGDDIIIMRDDVHVLFLQLPNHIKEFVTLNPDMSYTIVLNASHSHETHLEAYAHALHHIEEHDFDNCASADMIEVFAHQNQIETNKNSGFFL